MPLLNKFYSLVEHASNNTGGGRVEDKATHRADRLGHLGHHHYDREPSSTEGGDGEFIVNLAEFCLRVEYSHVVQL